MRKKLLLNGSDAKIIHGVMMFSQNHPLNITIKRI